MRILILFNLLLPITLLGGMQPADNPAAHSPSEIVRLASSSDFVATGTVTGSRPISKRLSEKAMKELDDLGKTLGGVLYTFRVEEVLCERADFKPAGTSARTSPTQFLIFKRRDTRFFQEESYSENQRYLIFLTAVPHQDQLAVRYVLDTGQPYYEAFEGKKGLVNLNNDTARLFSTVKGVCRAVKPPDVEKKLRRLNRLALSADPDVKQTALEAIKTIQNTPR